MCDAVRDRDTDLLRVMDLVIDRLADNDTDALTDVSSELDAVTDWVTLLETLCVSDTDNELVFD